MASNLKQFKARALARTDVTIQCISKRTYVIMTHAHK